jgi:hypothetical protein
MNKRDPFIKKSSTVAEKLILKVFVPLLCVTHNVHAVYAGIR